jgi:hypothetical protein
LVARVGRAGRWLGGVLMADRGGVGGVGWCGLVGCFAVLWRGGWAAHCAGPPLIVKPRLPTPFGLLSLLGLTTSLRRPLGQALRAGCRLPDELRAAHPPLTGGLLSGSPPSPLWCRFLAPGYLRAPLPAWSGTGPQLRATLGLHSQLGLAPVLRPRLVRSRLGLVRFLAPGWFAPAWPGASCVGGLGSGG